jgi:hypothetical protein
MRVSVEYPLLDKLMQVEARENGAVHEARRFPRAGAERSDKR